MTLQIELRLRHLALTQREEHRVRHHLASLDRLLARRWPNATAELLISNEPARGRVEVRLQVILGARALLSHQAAATADQAARLAVDDVRRQLERYTARRRGEADYGVPSRREPRHRAPAPPVGPLSLHAESPAAAPAPRGADQA
jgi:ribosome-associated translation inhibitor RaiA